MIHNIKFQFGDSRVVRRLYILYINGIPLEIQRYLKFGDSFVLKSVYYLYICTAPLPSLDIFFLNPWILGGVPASLDGTLGLTQGTGPMSMEHYPFDHELPDTTFSYLVNFLLSGSSLEEGNPRS